MLWLILFLIFTVISLAGILYFITRFRRFAFVQRISGKHKVLSWLICLVPLGVIGAFAAIHTVAVIVVVLHLIVFWTIADAIGIAIRKVAKKERRRYIEGAFAMLFTVIYLAFGWHNAHTVRRTEYTVDSDKMRSGESVKIVGIADAHLGITIDGDRFATEMKRIQSENPDIVVIAGDFVDDSSSRRDMVQACSALGELKTTYGVYFILGNHDEGYMRHRDFDVDDLLRELKKNNVIVLEDAVAEAGDTVAMVGRKDRSSKNRADIETLTKDIDPSRFILVLDHQPNDYASEAATGVDLVFSGHTHGGHIWPTGYIGLFTGANDRVYGTEVRNGTEFIVTSGISGWAIPFKTGTICEYVVMNVTKKNADF